MEPDSFWRVSERTILWFKLEHTVTEPSWVDLDQLKGYEVFSLPEIHISQGREDTKHTHQPDGIRLILSDSDVTTDTQRGRTEAPRKKSPKGNFEL